MAEEGGEESQADSTLSGEPDARAGSQDSETMTQAETEDRLLNQLHHPGARGE